MVNPRIHRATKLLAFIALLLSAEARAQSWQPIATMFQVRDDAKCVELKNGQILIAGGEDNSDALSECELYDPIKDQWTVTGSLNQKRHRFSLIALDDGRALAVGGLTDLNDATTAICELYDPIAGTWKVTASLPEASENIAALKLPNGKVFIAGGLDANTVKYLDFDFLYDPTTETLTRLPDMGIGRTGLLLYYNPDADTLMVCGGEYDGFYGFYLRSTSIYSFATNKWTLADSSIEPHDNSQIMAIEMPDNKPLLISGRNGPNSLTQNIESFDWSTGAWSHIGQMLRSQWHCNAFRVGDDSIVLIGGSTPDYQNVTRHTTWFQYSTKNSWAGSDMITPRYTYTGLLYDLKVDCGDTEFVFVFGGADTNSISLSTCEKLAVAIKSSSGTTTLTLPSTPQSLLVSGCAAEDTSVRIGAIGCDASNARLDSVWLVGSSAIKISDSRTSPRSLSASDSIAVQYSPSANASDTALLHIRYDIGSGARDTVVTIVGAIGSPLLSAPVRLHREVGVSYFGNVDTLPLGVDISSSVNLDSIWTYLHDISGTYAFDSSIISFYAYLPPNGWTLNSISNRGNAVDFTIHKVSSPSPSSPVNLGTALFLPNTALLATSDVSLTRFVMDVGSQSISPCVTEDEDQHWSVKVLSADGVSSAQSQTNSLSIYPNPAGDELFMQNPNAESVSITIYDAIGRAVLSANANASSTSGIGLQAIQPGAYMAVCHTQEGIEVKRIIKN